MCFRQFDWVFLVLCTARCFWRDYRRNDFVSFPICFCFAVDSFANLIRTSNVFHPSAFDSRAYITFHRAMRSGNFP